MGVWNCTSTGFSYPLMLPATFPASFELLYHRLNKNGGYIAEDTHTCYWPEYQGGLGAEGSFMEFVKSELDEINAVHTRGGLPQTEFTRSTDYIACYDSVIVFERRPHGHRQAPITGPMNGIE